ncbi:DUF4367 domain-containing protein [uncultured Oscillibacter sp.]|uniref:DUF4367 domain-containing protein n=1 Tax=uncultured Oscillibacter sp. TaxID=876091 RepID=UPI00260114F7|nr:DUF4367 domain-containing protein [uncultured Oscillibacter sp.]
MDEREALLRRALMEANLADYAAVPAGEPEFSPRYLRRRARLLADPFRWAKKRARPLWRRAVQSAACAALACAVALGAAMAVSPTVRAAVLGWLRELTGPSIHYSPTAEAAPSAEPPRWRPSALPEGWRLYSLGTPGPGGAVTWYYRNGEERLTFHCWSGGSVGATLSCDAEDAWEAAAVNGRPADFYRDKAGNLLVWEGADGVLFQLQGPLDRPALEEIAEGVAETAAEPLPAYRLGWLPEGAGEPYGRSVLREAVEEQFTAADGTVCSWLYASAGAGPLAVPPGEAEAVTVRGVQGRYWAPAAEDAGGVTVTVGSGAEGETYRLADADQTAVLVWTEDGVTFRLRGALDRDTLLRMAESVTAE